jgi:hypothetical protein
MEARERGACKAPYPGSNPDAASHEMNFVSGRTLLKRASGEGAMEGKVCHE